MKPQFVPPKNDEDFKKRAEEFTTVGAKAVLKARKKQREEAVKPFDDEIAFLEKVLESKGVKL
jgi:hypothetical protein